MGGRRPVLRDQDSAAALKAKRRSLKLTQGEVAKQAGISTPMLSRIESGERRATPDVLAKLKDALGITERLSVEPAPPVPSDEIVAQLGACLVVMASASLADLARALEVGVGDVRRGIQALNRELAGVGMQVVEDGVEARLGSRPELGGIVARARPAPEPKQMPRRMYESLAVVVAHGEAPRSVVEQARGVDCYEALAGLVERGYLESRTANEIPGRPMLYRATLKALELAGGTTIEGMQAQWEAFRDGDSDEP